MESSGPYTLEMTEGDRPSVISNAQGEAIFTFEQRDKRHAEETLENLNADALVLETVLLVGGPYDGQRKEIPPPGTHVTIPPPGTASRATADTVLYALRGDGTAVFTPHVSESLEDTDDLVAAG